MKDTVLPPKEDILGYECRFVVFCQNKYSEDDMHLVKEIIHLKDGRQIPHLRKLYNYQRPFWVAKKACRNYTQPKEWANIEDLREFKSTQSRLGFSIAKALEKPGFTGDIRSLYKSPYLYGADILSTALIKQRYIKHFPDLITPYSIACFDTEKDMAKGTGQINMATISFKERVFTAIDKSFFEGYTDVLNRLQQALMKYLGDYVKKRNITWEVKLVDSDTDVIISCMNKMHEWKPDFLAIWNMNFDVPLMVESLKKKNINPAWVFSDPSIENEFKFFRYKQGPNKKITDSGVVMSLKPAEQWHTVYTPSSSYFIDAMCVYQKLRIAEGSEQSYALDAILNKELGIRKLKFKEAEHLTKADWHIFMQEKYPFEYVIYNVFDCISMEELDEKTSDLQFSLPLFSGPSDFANFKSQPRRLVDNLHFVCLDQNKVIGVTSTELKSDLDTKTVPVSELIVTLAPTLRTQEGLKCIAENPNLRTNIYTNVADLDVSSSYPSNQAVFNISKETTKKELISVEGKEWSDVKLQTINLSGGYTNAVEFCTELLDLPTLDTLLDQFKEDQHLE